MELVDDPKCLYGGREESLIHVFLECGNVANLWRSIELWLRDVLHEQVKLFEIETCGIDNGDIHVNTVNLAAKEVIYIKHKTGGPLSLLQVKKRLFSQMKSERQ